MGLFAVGMRSDASVKKMRLASDALLLELMDSSLTVQGMMDFHHCALTMRRGKRNKTVCACSYNRRCRALFDE
jgi:hypothetical protein